MNPIVISSEESTSGTICGIVMDARGYPLEAATVILFGTPTGTMTGSNGEFSISGVAPGSYSLYACAVGKNSSTIDVIVTGGSSVMVEFKLSSSSGYYAPIIIQI